MKAPAFFDDFNAYLTRMREIGKEPTTIYINEKQAKTMRSLVKEMRREKHFIFSGFDARNYTYMGLPIRHA